MSDHEAAVAGALGDMRACLGIPITYSPSVGGDVARTAVCNLQDAFISEGEHGHAVAAEGEVIISSDATTGVELPTREDTITIRGNLWHVVTVNALADSWRLKVKLKTPLSAGAESFIGAGS